VKRAEQAQQQIWGKTKGLKLVESLLTPDELAAILKVPKSWIYGRIHSKTLPFPMLKIGHYCRFPAVGVRAYLKRVTRGANEMDDTAARNSVNKRI